MFLVFQAAIVHPFISIKKKLLAPISFNRLSLFSMYERQRDTGTDPEDVAFPKIMGEIMG